MAKKTNASAFKLGGSFFWTVLLSISIIGLFYLSVWSYNNNNAQGNALALIMALFIILGIILSKFEVFGLGNWVESSNSFLIGFIIWTILGVSVGTQSIFSLTSDNIFSSLASQLPLLTEFITTAIVIPIAEEAFWIVAIPFVLISLFGVLGDRFKIFKSKILLVAVMILITGYTFAVFHVSKQFFGFLVAAFLFRSIMVFGVYGSAYSQGIFGTSIRLLPAFAVGAHIGNNWANFGFTRGLSILTENFFPIGLIVYLFFFAIIGTSIWSLYRFLTGKKAMPKVSQVRI